MENKSNTVDSVIDSFLDHAEKKIDDEIANNSDKVEFSAMNDLQKINLNFYHPVEDVIWVINSESVDSHNACFEKYQRHLFIPLELNQMGDIKRYQRCARCGFASKISKT